PLNAAKHLVECFSKLPKNIIALNNAALCNDLVEEVQFAQEARLSKHCSLADLRKFTEEDLAKSINTFLKRTFELNSGVKKLKESGFGDGDVREYDTDICSICREKLGTEDGLHL
uniref:Uncharacterized protein n=1 Tax=Clytia hemisphaerica TaxID=252671 RepID=A0A7M5XJY1_9CNID